MPGKHHSDEFLEQVAREYREACKVEGKFRPNERIAEAHGVPVARVESWIKQARHREILEPHSRLVCSRCHRTLADLPPQIGHAHTASMLRMRNNAKQLEERCMELYRQATKQKRREDALVYRQAAYHYRAIAHLFAERT